jgi:F-box/leucine-rich repeat protein 2/20
LDITGCDKITDAGIRAVATGCPQLQSLSIGYDGNKITDEGIAALATECPQLQSLNMSDCDKITAGEREIAKRINYRK